MVHIPASAAEVTHWRDALSELAPAGSEAEAVDRLRALEELKATCAAAQTRETAQLKRLRLADEAAQGIATADRGKGLGAEVALARKDSPARGSRHLGLATAVVDEMPHTLAALTEGRIGEEHATVLCKETAWLPVEHRRRVDELMAHRLGEVGAHRLGKEARDHAQQLDQQAAVEHLERAQRERRVSVRPAPGNMAYLTALLPMPQAVAVYAGLHRDAATIVGTEDTTDPQDPAGQPRTRDQIAADLLVQRATGQATAAAVPAEVNLVMSDAALFGADDTPTWLTGHGPIPAATARHWLADPQAEIFMRRVFTRPDTGQLVAMESRGRTFPPALRRMVILRDDTCRTPYCDAPIRDLDHATPHRDGGPTSWQNASGLCAACNQTKENRGWSHHASSEQLTVTTPTGHRHTVETPPLLARRTLINQTNKAPPDATVIEMGFQRWLESRAA